MHRKILLGLLFGLMLAGVGAGILLMNPERYRSELSGLLTHGSHWRLTLNAPLNWQFDSGLQLVARNIYLQHTNHPQVSIRIARARLKMSFESLLQLNPALQIRSLGLENVTLEQSTDSGKVHRLIWPRLNFTDVSNNRSAHLSGDLSLPPVLTELAQGSAHLSVAIRWLPDQITLTNMVITLPNSHISGQFQARRDPASIHDSTVAEPLLRWHWQGDLHTDQLFIKGAVVQQVSLHTSLKKGLAKVTLKSGNFFQGKAEFVLRIDMQHESWHWQLQPRLENVQSQPLLRWLGKNPVLDSALNLTGHLQAQGNRLSDLVQNATADIHFDAGQGQLDVHALKQSAVKLSGLLGALGGSNHIKRWPERLAYQTFSGRWTINGYQHQAQVTLDNLAVAADGIIQPLEDRLQLHATVTFVENPIQESFEISPAMVGLPFPVDCAGRLSKPHCHIDREGVTQLLGNAMQKGSDSALRKKLERRIDKEVPEELRGAARALLDSLGDLLGNGNQ